MTASPIGDYVAVCRELGYDGPWGVEVLSEELRNLPIEQIFERAYETTSAHSPWRSEKGASVSENGLSKERLTWMYTQMARIREFEERVKRTFEEHPGVIRGIRIWPTAPRPRSSAHSPRSARTTSSRRPTAVTATRSRSAPTRRR